MGPDHPENGAELARRSAVGKFPLLVDGDAAVFEATAIIEYLTAVHPGPVKLITTDPGAAVKVRMMDRVFDIYVMNVMSVIVGNALRPDLHREAERHLFHADTLGIAPEHVIGDERTSTVKVRLRF